MSPTWPFSGVQSSGGRLRTMLGAVDNRSSPQPARTAPQAPRRARTQGAATSPLQRSGQSSAALGPSQDPAAATLLQPRPHGRQAAAPSGWPHTSMLPKGFTGSTALPSLTPQAVTLSMSISQSLHPERLLSVPTSPSSPLPSSFSKARPLSSPSALPDPSSQSKVADALLSPFAKEGIHSPLQQAQPLRGTPGLGPSGSSEKLSSKQDPLLVDSLTPQFQAESAQPFPYSLTRGSGLQFGGGAPSWPMLDEASRLASPKPAQAEVATKGVSLLALKHRAAVSHEVRLLPFQTTESVMVEMSSRKRPTAIAKDSAHPLPLSAVPEHSEGPQALSTESKLSSLVTSLPLTTAGLRLSLLSRAGLASPWNTAGTDVPSTPDFLQQVQNSVSLLPAPQMPTPQDGNDDRASQLAVSDISLSSKSPKLLSTPWTFHLEKEESVTATRGEKEAVNLTIALHTLPSRTIRNLPTVDGLASDFNSHPISSAAILTLRGNLLFQNLFSSTQAMQTLSPSPTSSNTRLETHTAELAHSELPGSASKQVTAVPSSAQGYDFSTIVVRKKPAITDVFWSSFLAETGSLSPEPMKSGALQQTNNDLNGHTINSTNSEAHSASATPPLSSAVSSINSQDFNNTARHFAMAEGFNIQDSVPGTSTNQPARQSDVLVDGKLADILSSSDNSDSRNFQASEFKEPSPNQRPGFHPPPHPLLLPSPQRPSTTSWQEMLSDGMDTSFQLVKTTSPSPVIKDATMFQGIVRYHSTAESPPLSNHALFSTPSKVLLASQLPKKGTGAAINAGSLFPGFLSLLNRCECFCGQSILRESPYKTSALLRSSNIPFQDYE